MENYDSGKIWAALYIVSCIKNVVNNKKLNDKGVAYNYKAKEKRDKDLRAKIQRKKEILKQVKEHKRKGSLSNQKLNQIIMNIDKKEAEKKKSMEKDLTIGLGDMKMTQEEMEQMLENDKEFGDHLNNILKEGPLYQKFGLDSGQQGDGKNRGGDMQSRQRQLMKLKKLNQMESRQDEQERQK